MKTKIAFISILFIAFAGCNKKKGTYTLPSASGPSGEILVIADKPLWQGTIGNTLREVFQSPQKGLPQQEPQFDMVNLLPSAFGNLFKTHRNLFIIDIDEKFKEPLVEAKRNVWSQPQMVVKISAANPKDIPEIIKEYGNSYLNQYLANERIRIINAFERTKSQEIENKLKHNFGLTLTVPTSFTIAKMNENFAWLRQETKDVSLGIMVHVANYEDTLAFNHDYIIELRNKLTKKHIPGPLDSSYMTTESHEEFLPVSSKIDFAGHYAVETVGLWRTVKAVMGGPFVRYTILDEKRNRIVTLEGFVYAPRYEKRDYVRQVEAIMHTVKYPELIKNTESKEK